MGRGSREVATGCSVLHQSPPCIYSPTDTHTHTHTYRFLILLWGLTKRHIFRGPEKSPRKKKRPRTFGPGHENVPQVRSHNTQIIQRACSHMRSWAHAHTAGAMLTSKDLPETYRNVHSEDAEDGHTARFSQDLKKVLARKNVLTRLVQGTKMSLKWDLTTHKSSKTGTGEWIQWPETGTVDCDWCRALDKIMTWHEWTILSPRTTQAESSVPPWVRHLTHIMTW